MKHLLDPIPLAPHARHFTAVQRCTLDWSVDNRPHFSSPCVGHMWAERGACSTQTMRTATCECSCVLPLCSEVSGYLLVAVPLSLLQVPTDHTLSMWMWSKSWVLSAGRLPLCCWGEWAWSKQLPGLFTLLWTCIRFCFPPLLSQEITGLI